jgi:hypothetical protein
MPQMPLSTHRAALFALAVLITGCSAPYDTVSSGVAML